MNRVRAAKSALPAVVPLDRRYDPARLADEVHALRDHRWRAQRAYSQAGLAAPVEIDWRILPLRSPTGDPGRTDPGGAGLDPYRDTPLLARSPYLAEVLSTIPAPLRAVRLMSLGPGAQVHEHRDGKCGYPWGVLRLHVPVITNPGAELVIESTPYHWDVGRLWFGDFDRPHYVRNTGPEPRVHLVIDCLVTRSLLDLFPEAYLDRLPWPDVLLATDPVPLRAADLAGLGCEFPVPADFSRWSEEDPLDEARPDVPGRIEVDQGRPVLVLAGDPTFALVHIGRSEFRLEGWTEERTLVVDTASPRPSVRFRVRDGRLLTEWVRPATIRHAVSEGALP
ncbi:aspartyl/asparaginyl beta-hydroxylase domain-containing protein [Micromonospora sp. NBC_01655]|uniref:aspartyl/asparaginyl beta-hydroxylase domain-containing protein n=1 Tax=Micromonospora sp. NBC_01655 TaxID=2975983 RepID=UPI0022528FD5|nr:aspartyl/asparaginyl beta-hydroxylase domain-containing protein [Micromonospora sp. NBC_01655]MCX4472496.1 aspartyl/asparaginyl beta-hydroxylase domain-containing protein [Micromonospora sp. NBC_01655]